MSARKYKQQGYQQDEPRERRPASTPRPPKEGPRGRGLGAPTRSLFKCARCGAAGEAAEELAAERLAVDARCSKCSSDLHTCTNCRHFDTAARFECRAEISERISAKAKANECQLFEPRIVQDFAADASGSGAPDDAKNAFDKLFDF